MDLEAFEEGILLSQIAEPSSRLPVGAPIGIIGEDGEDIQDILKRSKANLNQLHQVHLIQMSLIRHQTLLILIKNRQAQYQK